MTKKILIFIIVFTFFGLISFDKVFAVSCGNPGYPGICNAGTSCGSYDHEEPEYNNQCPSGQHCCVPNCVNDADCPACYSCEDIGFLGWYGKACRIDDDNTDKCSGTCQQCSNGTCEYNEACQCQEDTDCPECKICVFTGEEGELTGSSCVNAPNNSACNNPCSNCQNGTCETFCDDGWICDNTYSNCVKTCESQNGICRNGPRCRAGETQLTNPSNCNINSNNQICCTGGTNNTGTPCADSGNECTDIGSCIGIPTTNSECDEQLGKVCCTTPCITDFKGSCKDEFGIPEIGEYPVDNTECELSNTKCYTKKCSGDVGAGWCPEGSTCNALGNCEIANSDCKKVTGYQIVVGPNCPKDLIENEDYTNSLTESDIGKICCIPFTETRIEETSMFFKGIGSACMSNGNCSVNDIIKVAINVTKFLTGIIGSVALLFFIISGVMMIFSGGSEEKVTKAKTMMVQTVIGLFIFLGAYMIVSFIQESLDIGKNYRITSEPPKMVEVKPEEVIPEPEKYCKTDPIHGLCKDAKGSDWVCRWITNGPTQTSQGCAKGEKLCPGRWPSVCCPPTATAGTNYSETSGRTKQCTCAGCDTSKESGENY